MIHEMKLQSKYYNYIVNGTKRIELRLFDEKRHKINIGDKINFFNMSNLDECFLVEVIGLLRYTSFAELFKDFDISILSDKEMSYEKLSLVLEKFYPKEEQEKYGVLGIKFKLI